LISGIGAGPLGLDSPTLFLRVFFLKKIVKKLHLNKINEIIFLNHAPIKLFFQDYVWIFFYRFAFKCNFF
jgi:hypothetical protein